jgi:integrative and conjugative element protein (TIGR02256 family)
VVEATGPRTTDLRKRGSYIPDRAAEQAEITDRTATDLVWVGDWHTHPEDRPRPSELDIASIVECAERSSHDLNGLLLIVVGRGEPPDGLHVAMYESQGGCQLLAQPDDT